MVVMPWGCGTCNSAFIFWICSTNPIHIIIELKKDLPYITKLALHSAIATIGLGIHVSLQYDQNSYMYNDLNPYIQCLILLCRTLGSFKLNYSKLIFSVTERNV